jgi:hypothetical protein
MAWRLRASGLTQELVDTIKLFRAMVKSPYPASGRERELKQDAWGHALGGILHASGSEDRSRRALAAVNYRYVPEDHSFSQRTLTRPAMSGNLWNPDQLASHRDLALDPGSADRDQVLWLLEETEPVICFA